MTQDEIEEIAVHHMHGLLLGNKNLKADFSIGDKKPIIDGDISYYSPDTSINTNFEGSIKVQIKGHEARGRKPFADEITHTLKREYLEGFLNHGGVTFFVVHIRNGERKAYIRHLYIHDLSHILREMPEEQKSRKIRLSALSNKPVEITREIHFALQSQQQRKDIIVSDELMAGVEAITLVTPRNPDFQKPVRYGVGADPAVVKVKLRDGNEMSVPVAIEILPEDFVFRPAGLTISAGNVFFYDTMKRRVTDDDFEIALSPGLRLRINNNAASGKITLTTQKLLGDAKRDLDFLEAWSQGESIDINGSPWSVRLNNSGIVDATQNNHRIFSRLLDLCENLDIDPNQIRVEDLTSEVLERLEPVLTSIVDGEEMELSLTRTTPYDVRIGGALLKFFIIKNSEDGVWRFHGITDLETRQLWWTDGAKESPRITRVTPYEVMSAEALSQTLNLRLSSLSKAYADYTDDEMRVQLANECVLKLIHAADLSPSRRTELLDAAQALNSWLISVDGLDGVKKVNRWQIAVRLGELSEEIENEIREFNHSLKPDDEGDMQLRAGGEILLGQFGEAKYWLAKIDNEKKLNFETQPIYTLMKEPGLLESYLHSPNEDDKWSELLKSVAVEDFNAKKLHSN